MGKNNFRLTIELFNIFRYNRSGKIRAGTLMRGSSFTVSPPLAAVCKFNITDFPRFVPTRNPQKGGKIKNFFEVFSKKGGKKGGKTGQGGIYYHEKTF